MIAGGKRSPEEEEAQLREKRRRADTLDDKTRNYEACVFAGLSQVDAGLNMVRRMRNAGGVSDYSSVLAAMGQMMEMCKNAKESSEEARKLDDEIAREEDGGC